MNNNHFSIRRGKFFLFFCQTYLILLFVLFKFWYRGSARGSADGVWQLACFASSKSSCSLGFHFSICETESYSASRHRRECFRTSVHNGFSIPQIPRGISLSLSRTGFFLSLERLFSLFQGFSYQNNNLWGLFVCPENSRK